MDLGHSERLLRGLRWPLAGLIGLALSLVFAPSAAAQLSKLTAAPQPAASPLLVRGVAAAYDPVNNRYLVVGAMNHVIGVLVDSLGAPVSPLIVIKPNGANNIPYGSFPRASYSPHLNSGNGGFLVTWATEKIGTTQLHMRVVTSTGIVLGTSDIVVTDSNAWKDVAGAAIAYSPTSQVFLIVWKVSPVSQAKVRVLRVKVDNTHPNGASLLGPSVIVSSGFGRDPGATWNSAANEFGISYAGENGSQRFVAFVRVPVDNPAGFARTTFNVLSAGTTAVTDISFNPVTGRYILSWWEASGGVKAKIAEINQAGTVVGMGVASTKIGSYDALSSAFNPISKTFLLAGLDSIDNVIGAELNGHGVRLSAEQNIIAMPPNTPARYNRVETSHTGPRWMNVISRKFGAIWGQVVQTSTTEGGSSTAYPPPGSGGNPPPPPGGGNPPPPPSSKKAWVWTDTPNNLTNVPRTFNVAGWAIDENVTNSVTGINAVHIYAYPNCVACGGTPVMLGGATYGISRPDIGQEFGARFTSSGYHRTVTVPYAGTWDIAVFARKTSNNTWIAKVVRVTAH